VASARSRRRLVFAAAIAALSGCAAAKDYLLDRAGDLSDAFQAAFGGPAIGVHVEATVLVHVGLDAWWAYGDEGGTVGNFHARLPGTADYAAYSIVVFHARGVDTDPAARDPSNPDHFPPPHGGFPTHAHELGRAFEEPPRPEHLRLLRWLDLEVDAAWIAGLRARWSPGETVDFLLGWFGIDLAGDDGGGGG
jgi:hypothetical protein